MVSNALEKSSNMTTTKVLNCSKLITVGSREMMAADVEPMGAESKLIQECQSGRRVQKRRIKECADHGSLRQSLMSLK